MFFPNLLLWRIILELFSSFNHLYLFLIFTYLGVASGVVFFSTYFALSFILIFKACICFIQAKFEGNSFSWSSMALRRVCKVPRPRGIQSDTWSRWQWEGSNRIAEKHADQGAALAQCQAPRLTQVLRPLPSDSGATDHRGPEVSTVLHKVVRFYRIIDIWMTFNKLIVRRK